MVESPGYFDAIRLPLLLGRDFDETDGTADHKSAIVTRECAAHFWPNQTAIGKRFRFYDDKNKPGDWITVVGVVANIAQDLNEKDPKPLLFVPFRQEGWNGMALSFNLPSIQQLPCARCTEPRSGPASARCFHAHRGRRSPGVVSSSLYQAVHGVCVIALLMASIGYMR